MTMHNQPRDARKNSSDSQRLPYHAILAVRNGGIFFEDRTLSGLGRQVGNWLADRSPDEDDPGDWESNLAVFVAIKHQNPCLTAGYFCFQGHS